MRGIKKGSDFIIPVAIASLFILFSLAYGNYRLNNIFTGERLRVSVVQGNIPQDEKWDSNFRDEILDKYDGLTKKAASERPDLIIWPEASVPGFLETEQDLLDRIKALALGVKTPLLVGAPREDRVFKDSSLNSAILFSEDGTISGYYDKLHLVPFGEYIPFKSLLSFVDKFAPRPIGDFIAGKDRTVFEFFIERSSKDKDFNWRLLKKVSFSSLICFEDIFPDISRGFVKRGALFLVNMTNDAWFKRSSAPYQHAQSSIFRAVENRVNVVRAANTGLSCFIDPKGRIVDRVETAGEDIFVDGIKSHEITLTKTRTLYNLYGDIFAYLSIFLTCLGLIKFARLAP